MDSMQPDLYNSAERTLISLLKKYESGDLHEGLVDALYIVHRQKSFRMGVPQKGNKTPYRLIGRRAA